MTERETTEAKLLEAGIALFGELGFKATTTRMIADKAGANIGSIAYYFGNKQGLYLAIVGQISRRILEKLSYAQMPDPQPLSASQARDMLTQTLHRMIDVFATDAEAEKWLMLVLREQVSPTQAFEALYENAFSRVQNFLCVLVAKICDASPHSREVILQTHMLVGQVTFLLVGRTPLLRRLGSQQTSLSPAAMESAKAIVARQVQTLNV
ncbi:CerR family C-terminal domain-containing protein [Gilvimarinus xylanilyticus]|uniref:CerR family C-terminal domain-containing protein n=1 Tax=Gilvimarinus xylanilyticus TaxID=2944139 RepID=A0A9X2I493_9GAMM|nr:CerR family C-terminal domain-containing protein [Gilvimarinus xylanilyticus]MCP8900080.1 CerR family C-terminal domain-containing protein [Gilvimarinus xylanilyticus]